jgi:hypothetical protein
VPSRRELLVLSSGRCRRGGIKLVGPVIADSDVVLSDPVEPRGAKPSDAYDKAHAQGDGERGALPERNRPTCVDRTAT